MSIVYGLYSGNVCIYIGSTNDYDKRIIAHESKSAVPKYIKWEPLPLEECNTEDRYKLEALYIQHLRPKYNKYKMISSIYNKTPPINLQEVKMDPS